MRHDQWGTIGTSSADGRTGTHEVGHTFGLYHTFLSGSAGCGSVCDTTGDEVCDTPPNTYSGACSQLANTCTNDTSGNSVYDTNVVDQIENYMSYNTCQNMLSEGQKTRMRGFIAEFSILQGLSSDSNLFATGLIDTIPLHIKDEVRDGFVISVSPNPFYDEITFLVPKDLNTDRNNIRLINLLGQEMNYSIQYNYMIRNEQSVTLQVPSDLKSGLYFLKVGRNIAKVVKE